MVPFWQPAVQRDTPKMRPSIINLDQLYVAILKAANQPTLMTAKSTNFETPQNETTMMNKKKKVDEIAKSTPPVEK